MYAELLKIPHFNMIKDAVIKNRCEAYFVGGCVRDILLGRDVHDVDLVCFSHSYHDFARLIKGAVPSVWVEFKDNIRLVRGRTEIDISKPRGETLAEDLTKRDFTINNLAMDISGEIFGDTSDLEKKRIRHVSSGVFEDDPLRILRTFRFQSQLGFEIVPETIQKARSERFLLELSASERIFAELDKLFKGRSAVSALYSMDECGVYSIVTGGLELNKLDTMSADTGRGLVFLLQHSLQGWTKMLATGLPAA